MFWAWHWTGQDGTLLQDQNFGFWLSSNQIKYWNCEIANHFRSMFIQIFDTLNFNGRNYKIFSMPVLCPSCARPCLLFYSLQIKQNMFMHILFTLNFNGGIYNIFLGKAWDRTGWFIGTGSKFWILTPFKPNKILKFWNC